MKKLVLLIGLIALFSCEKPENECWLCDEIHRYELENNAYTRDTVLIETDQFIVCGLDNKIAEIGAREDEQIIEHLELQGTVFYWTGMKYIEVECKKWK